MWNRIKNWVTHQVREWAYQLVVAPVEPIDIIRGDGLAEHDVLAQIDVLREETLIDAQLAKDLGIYQPETVNERKEIAMTDGKKHLADVIQVSFTIQGQERTSRWLVVDRSQEIHLVCLGKQDVSGLYIFIPKTQ